LEDIPVHPRRGSEHPRKKNAGPKVFDAALLFKIFILQSLYNLANDALGFQIRGRFSRFLGRYATSKMPDATTIEHFREDLAKTGKV